MTVLEKASWNGWMFWQVVNPDGTTTILNEIRRAAIDQEAQDALTDG
jgi:hypothetical protein